MDASLKEDEDKKPWGYFLACTAFFFGMMYFVADYVQASAPNYFHTDSSLFQTLYFRYYVNTDIVSGAQLLYFAFALPIAFTFVNISNLQLERGDPFKGAQGGYKSFKQTIFLGFVMFFVSGIVVLRQKYDLQGYCEPSPANSTVVMDTVHTQMAFNHTAAAQLQSPLSRLMLSIDKMNYLQDVDHPYHPTCSQFSDAQIVGFNYWVWTLAFYIGLQFTHLDTGVLQNLTLDWEVMKNWPWYMWVIFLGLILLLITLLAYVFFLYYTIGYLNLYLLILAGIVGYFVVMSKAYAGQYRLHFHHYFLGMCGAIFMCYQNGFVSAVNAIFTGIMIEGGCRWGYSSMWVKEDEMMDEKKLAIITRLKQSQARSLNATKSLKTESVLPTTQVTQQEVHQLTVPFIEQQQWQLNTATMSAPPRQECQFKHEQQVYFKQEYSKIDEQEVAEAKAKTIENEQVSQQSQTNDALSIQSTQVCQVPLMALLDHHQAPKEVKKQAQAFSLMDLSPCMNQPPMLV